MRFEFFFVHAAAVAAAILGVLTAIWGLYYLILALPCFRREFRYPSCPAQSRFAVLIAARNEEAVIAPLVQSLRAQDYPKTLYDIIVIPNNCTDRTAETAQAAGATILDCTVPVRSKGEVLHFALERLMCADYDAFCVFDADNLVHPQFLTRMNDALCGGALAAQGYRDSKNPLDTAVSGCYSIYYWMMDRFFNRAKAGWGLSAMINGTGFVLSRSALERLDGWNTKTISEDLEITVQCILSNISVAWIPDAVTYDEQPLTFQESVKQRRRWISGTIQTAASYLPQLRAQICRGIRKNHIDLMMTMLLPVYQVLLFFSSVLGFLAAVLAVRTDPALLFIPSPVLNLITTVFMTTAVAFFTVILEKGFYFNIWKGILLYSIFTLSWLPLSVFCLFFRTTSWEPIRHTRNISQLPLQKRPD